MPGVVVTHATSSLQAHSWRLPDRSFTDVRPQHGFAFVRLSAGDATLVDLAQYLDMTKQAAGQLVEQLVARGYVSREPHPTDGRARLLVLTDQGRACTRGADEAVAETSSAWREQLGDGDYRALRRALTRLTTPGPLRPSW